jgi:hypothetical protein
VTDLPPANLVPGRPFEAKARKKRRKGTDPVPAATRTLPFDKVRPFLSGKPLRGLGDQTAPNHEPAPEQDPKQDPKQDPDADRGPNLAA